MSTSQFDEFQTHPSAATEVVSQRDLPAASVVASSIISFSSGVSGQQLRDVQNSVLFAERMANGQFPEGEDNENWYKVFSSTLNQLGWIMQELTFCQYESPHNSFKLSQVTLELLTTLLAGDEELLSVVKKTFDCFNNSPPGLTLFKENSLSAKSGHFQILPCTVKNGQVVLAFIGAHFKAPKVSDNYFFCSYNSQELGLHTAKTIFTLNEEVYGKVRQEVIERLGEVAAKCIHELII